MYESVEFDINTGEIISIKPLIITNELIYFAIANLAIIIFLIIFFKIKKNNIFISNILKNRLLFFFTAFILGIISLFIYVGYCPSIFSPLPAFIPHIDCEFYYFRNKNILLEGIFLNYFYIITYTYPLINWLKDSIFITFLLFKLKINIKNVKFLEIMPVVLFLNIISYCILPFYVALINLWFEMPNFIVNPHITIFDDFTFQIIYILGKIIGSVFTTILIINFHKTTINKIGESIE